MARIPEQEIERLKKEVSVERLVESAGIELKKSGRDLLGRCPFHEDDTASLVVTPAKNLWHCFGCGIGGGPIDWAMKLRGISFRHAVEQLREGVVATSLAADSAGIKRSTVRALAAPIAFDADDQALLNQTVGYYHERLLATSEATAYLTARGLEHPELAAHFKLGVADRSLGLRLPEKNRKAGADIRAQLQKLGLYRDSGHEHFNGSLIVPVFDEAGNVVEVYGRKLLDNLRAGTPKHLYLPAREGRNRGVFNIAALAAAREIILCEALIDALTFWCAGYRNVTAAYGIEGFTDAHIGAFKRHGTERVLIAYDRDEAGERGAAKVADALMALGIECWRIQFPKGMDANEYALKVQPASKSLGLLIRKAIWLGKGAAPARASDTMTIEPAAKEAKPEPSEPEAIPLPSLAAAAAPAADTAGDQTPQPEIDGDILRLTCGARVWQVRGLPKTHPGASLKLNVRVQQNGGGNAAVPALHVDSVDLYSARARAVFAVQAVAELGGHGASHDTDLEHDLQALLEEVGHAARAAGTAMVIFIDELQYVQEDELAALITAMHRCAQRRVPVMLVGAGLPQLRGRMGNAKSYAERLFDFPQVGALPTLAARVAITKPVKDQGVEIADEAVTRIIEETNGYPYFLQEWGKHAWDAASVSPIRLQDVEQAIDSAIAALDESFFRVRFDRLTPAEKKYLRAMAELGPGPHRSGDIADTLMRKVTSLGPTRNNLIAKGMIWSPNHGDTAFTVPLFDQFMRRIMPGVDWQ